MQWSVSNPADGRPSWAHFCRAGRSRLRTLSSGTFNLTAVTFLWTLVYWKLCWESLQNKKKKKRELCTTWFSCHWSWSLCFFPAAHHRFPFLGLPAAGWPTKIPIPWPCDLRPPDVWPVPARHSRENSLHGWCSHRVPGLPREALCRELALGRYVPVLHLSMYEPKCLAMLVFFCTQINSWKFRIPFLLLSFPELNIFGFFFFFKSCPHHKKYMVVYMLSYICCTYNRCVTAFRVCVSRCVKRGNLSSSSVTERMISSASARQATT